MINSKRIHYKEIDGLRALAVLAVMFFHLNDSILPGGFSGVDIFFVVSGYVVSKSLAERKFIDGYNYFVDFYSRRIIRIIPALLVMLVVVSIFTTLFIPSSWLSSATDNTGLAAFAGLSNIALVLSNDGYFSPRIDYNPFAHTWSLGVEEQFYLFFPVVFLLWIVWRKKTGVKGTIAWWILPILTIASLYTSYWLGLNKPDWGYYLIPSRFWELAAGAMLYQHHTEKRFIPTSNFNATWQLWIGFSFILAGLWWSDRQHFPFPWALLSVTGTLLFINSVIDQGQGKSICKQLFNNAIAVYLGKISYSLYLWHWPIYSLMRWTIGLETIGQQLLALTLTMLFSMTSYHLIEKGIQRSASKLSISSLSKVLGGLTVIVLTFQGTSSLFDHRHRLSLSDTKDSYTWYAYDHEVKNINEEAGQIFGTRQMFVIGDSHAYAYSTMLNEASKRLGVSVYNYALGRCALGIMLLPINTRAGCEGTSERMMDIVEKKAKPGDIVFFASLRTYRLIDQWALFDPQSTLNKSKNASTIKDIFYGKEETSILIERLNKMGVNVLIDLPKPVFNAPPFRCSDWFNQDNPICKRGFYVEKSFLVDMMTPVVDSLKELNQKHDNLILWDNFSILCPDKKCSAFDAQGKPLFFDGDHLSGHGNRVLYPDFKRVLKQIWGSS